jgi:hypothetical protein
VFDHFFSPTFWYKISVLILLAGSIFTRLYYSATSIMAAFSEGNTRIGAAFWETKGTSDSPISLAASVNPIYQPSLLPQQSADIEYVGHIGGITYAVAVSGNYVYIGEGPCMVVLDASNPEAPWQEDLHAVLR